MRKCVIIYGVLEFTRKGLFFLDKNLDFSESSKVKAINKKKLTKRFAFIVLTSVVLYTLLAAAAVLVYGITRDDQRPVVRQPEENINEKLVSENEKNIENISEELKIRTNIAVFGTDSDGIRTDVMFVVSFNSETKEINLISIPRDTKFQMSNEMMQDLVDRNRAGFIPYLNGQKGICKINEVHAYAGEGYRNEYSTMALEDLLGIEIDYYVKFTTSSFRYVVDAIGGIEFTVPMNMNYEDPEQGLYIHLKAGTQILDGDKAEQLVRFREGYASKDLKRIEVQQDFMLAVIKKVLSTETLLSNMAPLTKMVLSYVETDASVMDALKNFKYIDDISLDKVTMETIPGVGGSYYTYNEKELKEIVDRIFKDVENDEAEIEEQL